MAIDREISHEKWWFSTDVSHYQRVHHLPTGHVRNFFSKMALEIADELTHDVRRSGMGVAGTCTSLATDDP